MNTTNYNKKKEEISSILGGKLDLSNLSLISKTFDQREKAIRDLYELSLKNKEIKLLTRVNEIDFGRFKEIYEKLILSGAGQWVGEVFVPVETLLSPRLVELVLTVEKKYKEKDFNNTLISDIPQEWMDLVLYVIDYIEDNETVYFLIFSVNKLLSKYIDVHNLRFNDSGTLNSLFKHKDYEKLMVRVTIIKNEFDLFSKVLDQVKSKISDSVSERSKLIPLLTTYFNVLHKTVIKLLDLIEKDLSASKGNIDLNFLQKLKSEREYNNLVREYTNLGLELNKEFNKFQAIN